MSLSPYTLLLLKSPLKQKVRPERALSATVIAASVAVAASPMSAATAGMLAILHEYAGDHVRANIILLPFLRFLWLQLLPAFQSTSVVKNWKMILNFKRRVAAGEYEFMHTEQKKKNMSLHQVQEKGLLFLP